MPARPDPTGKTPQDVDAEDWDALDNAEPLVEDAYQNGDMRPDEGDLPGEDDDNPFEESDEALPDDEEEAAISSNLKKLEE